MPELLSIDAAAAVKQSARDLILDELLYGGAYTASELATRVGITRPITCHHLRELRDEGLVSRLSQGRYRFFRLASPDAALALRELLGHPDRAESRTAADVPRDIRFARSCYGHLAGWLGVTVTQAFVSRGLLASVDGELEVTPSGLGWLRENGVALPEPRGSRQRLARRCLDWTEKRPHLAGIAGTALLSRFISLGWIQRRSGERTLEVTEAGQAGLSATLGLSFAEPPKRLV